MADDNKKNTTVINHYYKPDPMGSLVWILIAIAALYVTFRCVGEVTIVDILAALCCGPCYLVYSLYLLFGGENNGCGLV
jgi:hypothetical protein